jgi:drug/metabolite transporter (DMT)-like permease
MNATKARTQGIFAAAASAVFLGLTPIFGKQSLNLGFSPFAVVAVRTVAACLLLFLFLLIFKRQNFYIYPLGLAGCMAAGVINGVGSTFFYAALARLDAGIGQLLYSFYPLFMVFWLLLDRQSVSRLTILRLLLVLPGVYLLLQNPVRQIDLTGAFFMLIAAILYSFHLLINQRVLYDVPAPTVTFYTLLAMSLTVLAAFFIFSPTLPPAGVSWAPLIFLSVITFLSRVTLFLGVKHLGGIQTAILGLGELLVTVVIAQIFLAERLVLIQWVGALLVIINLVLVVFDKPTTSIRYGRGFLYWLTPPPVKPYDSTSHDSTKKETPF